MLYTHVIVILSNAGTTSTVRAVASIAIAA